MMEEAQNRVIAVIRNVEEDPLYFHADTRVCPRLTATKASKRTVYDLRLALAEGMRGCPDCWSHLGYLVDMRLTRPAQARLADRRLPGPPA